MAFFKKKNKEVPASDDSEPKTDELPESEDDVSSLTDSEFNDYIKRLKNGEDTEADEQEEETEDEGGDEDSEEDTEEDTEEVETEVEHDPDIDTPFRTYSTEAEYNADVEKAVSEARKQWDLDNQAVQARAERMERIAHGFFPGDESGLDKLSDELEGQLAERDGISVDEYRKRRDTAEKADKWDAFEKKKTDGAEKQKAIVDKWVADAGNIKVLYPDFDLEEAMHNKEFVDVLTHGGDMFSAYAKVYNGNKNPEPETEAREEDKEEPEPKRPPIKQNGQGTRRGTASASEDYSKMPRDKFLKEIEKMRNA